MPQKKLNKEITYEKAMSRLEEIAALLESGSVSLDDSISLFDESVGLIAFCDKKLKTVRQKIEIVSSEPEEAEND